MSDAWNGATKAVSGATDKLFGDGDTAGLLGTGQERFNPYQIDASTADRSQDGQRLMNQGEARTANVENRQAPTMNSAQIGAMQQGTASQIAPNERVQNQNIGQVERFGGAQLGPAAQGQAATIQRDDLGARAAQGRNADALEQAAAGNGPSLAGGMLQDAQDRNAKQAMSLTASTRGQGNGALAQRQAMNGVQASNQQGARDAAQMKIQEQQTARGELQGQLGQMRDQDNSINTQQAQLNQSMNLNNVGAQNNFALQQGQFGQQAGLANQAASNQRQLDQSQLNYNTMANNAGATNNRNLSQAQLNQQQGLANQQDVNSRTMNQAQLQQQANANNQQAYLQNQGQNDAAYNAAYGAQVGMDQADRQAQMGMQGMEANQDLGVMGLEQRAYDSSASRNSGVGGGLVGGLTGMVMSDETQKTDIKGLSDSDLDDIYGIGSGGSKTAPAWGDPNATSDGSPGGSIAPKVDGPVKSDPMKDAMGKAGKAGSMNPASLITGAGTNLGKGLSQTLSNSILGDVLSQGSSPISGPSTNPTGDVALNHDASMNVNGTLQNINQSEVVGPMNHPGGQPMSGGGGFGIGAFRISDKHQKEQVVNVDDNQVKKDMGKVGAHEYEYVDQALPGTAKGKQVSPMAQELEETKLFGGSVIDTPNGKMVDYPRAFGGMLAGMAMMNRRIDKLDKKGKN